MAQKQGDWVDIPAEEGDWKNISADEHQWETIPAVPSRAQGAGPAPTGKEPQLPGPEIRAYTPSLYERFTNEVSDAYHESRMPHLPEIPWITKPPEFLTEGARKASMALTQPHSQPNPILSDLTTAEEAKKAGEPLRVNMATPEAAFVGGALEGAAGQATGLNVGLALAGQGEVTALRNATKLAAIGDTVNAARAFKAARGLEAATRAVSAPLGYESLATVTDPNATPLERISAVPGLAGAALGMRSRVREIASQTPVREVPLKEGSVVGESTPEGPKGAPKNILEGEVVEPKPETALATTKPGVVRPNTITIKMGPKTFENMQKMIGEGYRVQKATGEEVVLTREPAPPTDEEPLFSRVKDGLDEKTAIIEDQGPKWEGVGPNGEDYHNVGIPVKSADGEWHLSHGILDPKTQAKLESEGIRLVKRSEMDNIPQVPVEEDKTFGVPQESLTPADRSMSDARLDDLTRKFADMATARTPPAASISDTRRTELLGKLGGKQVETPDEGIQLSRNIDDNERRSAQEFIDRGAKTPLDDDLDAHSKLLESIYTKKSRGAMSEHLRQIIEEKDPEKISSNYLKIKQYYQEALDRYNNGKEPEGTNQFIADQTNFLDAREMLEVAEDKYKYVTNKQLLGEEPLFSKNRPVDESGQPIQTREFTPEELVARKKQIATDWYNARKEATEVGVDHKKYRNLDELRAAIQANKINAARTETGRAKIGVNVARSAQELTTGYSGSLPGIMVREGLQNAFDAMKAVGGGEVKIRIERARDGGKKLAQIEIQDFGKGMTRQELETVFSNLHESGKINQAGATGGKGVGKASYMLGGAHFKVETVVKEGSKKLMNTFQGTPEELMSGFDINTIEVPKDTPTGTRIMTTLNEGQESYGASNMLSKVQKYSRGVPVKIERDAGYGKLPPEPMRTFADDKKIGEQMIGNNKVAIYIPKDTKKTRSHYLELRILNNGMYQYDHSMYLGEEHEGIPADVLVDIRPQMEEGAPDYPFPVQRESVKDNVQKAIDEMVKESLINPLSKERGMALSTFWNDLPHFPIQGTNRDTLLFDAGSRLTPSEKHEFLESTSLQLLTHQLDELIHNILQSSNPGQSIEPGTADRPQRIIEHDWSDKVRKTGIILDPSIHGIHIPDPSNKGATSAILLNPFNHINRHSPEKAAIGMVVTALHEVAHVGKTVRPDPTLLPDDLEDPRVGEFLQTYLKEVNEQGGLDLGHGMDFVHRLGNVYAAFGSIQFGQHVDAITNILAKPGESGGYRPEIQRLLHVYNDSRGRDEVKADILSRTGIKSSVTGSGKSPVSGNSNANGDGITRLTLKGLGPESTLGSKEKKSVRKTALDMGLLPTGYSDKNGNPIWQKPKDEELSKFKEIWNLPRGLMSVDLPFITSAALRQGIPLIGPNFAGWLKAWGNSARAYSSAHAAAAVTDRIAQDPIFRRGRDAKGNPTASFAEVIGLEMTGNQSLNGREEMLKSKWVERIPLYGRHVTASNRAFEAFMNTLRASSITRFLHQATEDSLMFRLSGGRVGVEGRDPTQNIALAKSIAEAVNVLTGRGKIELQVTPETRLTKSRTYSADHAAKLLTDIFFAPKLTMSRVKMLNPNTYISADPFTRKLYMKGILSAIATWWAIAALIEASGGEVDKDPNSADFGKGRIGNTRIDPGAGFQQFIVLGSRIRPKWFKSPIPIPFPPYGELVDDPGGQLFTSSTTGRTSHLGKGFRPLTTGELLQNFTRSKLNPPVAMIVDMLYATQSRQVAVGDRTIQMVAPMMTGDLLQVLQEDPSLAPLVLGASNVGMGGATYTGGDTKPTFTPMIENLTGIPVSEYDPTVGRP